MAQKVQLTKKTPPTPEMLAKVTAAGRQQPPPPVPPAAKPTAKPFLKPPPGSGVKGDMPLPIGKAIPIENDLPGWDAQQPYAKQLKRPGASTSRPT